MLARARLWHEISGSAAVGRSRRAEVPAHTGLWHFLGSSARGFY